MNNFVQNNVFFQVSAEKISVPERAEIEEKHTWNLKDIYANDGEWENDFNWIEEKLSNYRNYKGKLNQSADVLLSCLKFDDSIGIKLDRLYLYAMLSKDSDLRVNKYQSMDDRIKTLYSKVGAASSFIHPEILKIPAENLLHMISSNDELKVYEHSIKNLIRIKDHTLSDS